MEKLYFVIIFIALSFYQTKALAAEPLGEVVYTGEIWQVADGGTESNTRYLHNIDLTYGGDLGTYGSENSSFFLHGLINNKSELSSEIVGDLQVISNIDNGEVIRLYEVWFQHEFSNLRVKMGLIDLNSEFDVIEPAGLFINSSHGIGPDFSQTGENGPSIFPSTSPAFLMEFTGLERWRLMLGIFDAVPNDPENPKSHKLSLDEGALLVGEANYTMENGLRIGFGFYSYTSQFTPLLTPSQLKRGNRGAYGIIEGPLTDNIMGWLRYGRANGRLNPISQYLGGGLVLNEPFTGRSGDQLGLAFGWAKSGNEFKQMLITEGDSPTDGELNIELTYHYKINESIKVQPDIQYVINPGGTNTIQDALVVGIRFKVGQFF